MSYRHCLIGVVIKVDLICLFCLFCPIVFFIGLFLLSETYLDNELHLTVNVGCGKRKPISFLV